MSCWGFPNGVSCLYFFLMNKHILPQGFVLRGAEGVCESVWLVALVQSLEEAVMTLVMLKLTLEEVSE